MSCLKNEPRSKEAIISDAFSGILGDATRSALITDEEIEDLIWIDQKIAIKEEDTDRLE